MYSKFIKLIVLVSLLVCCGFAGRVLYGRFPQLRRTRERSTSHRCRLKTTKEGINLFNNFYSDLFSLEFDRHF